MEPGSELCSESKVTTLLSHFFFTELGGFLALRVCSSLSLSLSLSTLRPSNTIKHNQTQSNTFYLNGNPLVVHGRVSFIHNPAPLPKCGRFIHSWIHTVCCRSLLQSWGWGKRRSAPGCTSSKTSSRCRGSRSHKRKVVDIVDTAPGNSLNAPHSSVTLLTRCTPIVCDALTQSFIQRFEEILAEFRQRGVQWPL
jgi:hypothetical protein